MENSVNFSFLSIIILKRTGKRSIRFFDAETRYEIIAKYRSELIEILERLDAINKAFEVLFFI